MSFFTKQEQTHSDIENKLMATKEERGVGTNWEY